MLKTSHISASATPPSSRTSPKTGGTGSGSAISKPTSALSREQVQQAAAGDVGEAVHAAGPSAAARAPRGRRSRSARAARRPRVAPPSALGAVVERERRRARGARASSRWSAGRDDGQADQRVAGRGTSAPVTIASSATVPKQAAVRSKPFGDGWPRISSGSTATSPPGISTPASSAPRLSPTPICAHHLGVGLLDGQVVEQRDRLGADADDVVDVHRDAVDPDGVVAAGLLGDDQLRADAVGAERDPEVRAPPRARRRSGRAASTVRDGRPRSIVRSTSTSAATPRSAAAVSTPDCGVGVGHRARSCHTADDHAPRRRSATIARQRRAVGGPAGQRRVGGQRALGAQRGRRRAAPRRRRRPRASRSSPPAAGGGRAGRPSAPPRPPAPAARPRATARAASARPNPRARAAARVAPLRDTPGISARACASPSQRAVRRPGRRRAAPRGRAVGEHHRRRAGQQAGGDRRRRAEPLLDRPLEQRARPAPAAPSPRPAAPQPRRRRIASASATAVPSVQRHLELLARAPARERPARQQQPDVGGRGDRQQLGRALQQPERDRLSADASAAGSPDAWTAVAMPAPADEQVDRAEHDRRRDRVVDVVQVVLPALPVVARPACR